MGGPGSGAPRRLECVNGHDLTDEANVALAKRGERWERQCILCRRDRSRAWWRKNRAVARG